MKKSQDSKKDETRKDKNMKSPLLKEKLTPEEVWKNAAILLGTKKKETVSKSTQGIKSFDFGDVCTEIEKVNRERISLYGGGHEDGVRRFYEIEASNSLVHIPNFRDLEKNYMPRTPVETPSFFPKSALYVFESQDIFKKLDIDTLFFIFYSQLGTIQQYYAAAQLKTYSWRFHTKYFTWFQRLDEPKLITADYERGDFLFFDYDVTWSFMKKSDFTFEYKYLECSEW